MAAQLRRVRDRVLRGAQIRSGQRVLDAGAGTGLLALEACRRVGPTGLVIAVDISIDALRECGRQAASDMAVPFLHLARGDVLRLPVQDGSFDAVMTRSVLIYVEDKSSAVREFYRVLRPGGRVSVFEPINSASNGYAWNWGLNLSALQPAHDRIVAYLREGFEHEGAMLGFDERDLIHLFVEAGFESVNLSYEHRFHRGRRRASEVLAFLRARPNPSLLSYEEGARAVLGDVAEEHLTRLSSLVLSQATEGVQAAAFIAARR